MKITYLFTTFPLLSERFLQREVEAMRDLGVELELFSLFRGNSGFSGLPVLRFRWWHWLRLPGALFIEYICSPRAFHKLGREFASRRPAEAINFVENFLGFAFAILWAPHFRRSERHHIHAVWATAPAAAATWLKELTGTPFSMGAHAYDVFRHEGDWILENKLQEAFLIHTSTEATKGELLRRGAPRERVVMIRRGLNGFPEIKPIRKERSRTPIRLLSVGRLIRKKGFDRLLEICAALHDEGIPFECRIVGGGPLSRELRARRHRLGIDSLVEFTGAQPYVQVAELYRWADLFCFTGGISSSNDRDGLPNVIAEAMAFGLPVLSSPVSGTVEAVEDGVRGYLIAADSPKEWVQAIRRLREDDEIFAQIRTQARAWVETHFDARKNARRLLDNFARADERKLV